MMEIDITNKVGRAIKYGAAGILLFLFSIAGIIYSWQMNHRYVMLHDGRVVGRLVHVKNMAPGVVTEILVTDGETVEEGQPLAKLRVKILPEQISKMEKAVETAKTRYQEILTRPEETGTRQAVQAAPWPQAAKNELERAKREKEKMDKLFAIGGISAVKHKEAVSGYERALQVYQARLNAPDKPSGPDVGQRGGAGKETLLKVAALQVRQTEEALAKMRQEQIVEIKAVVGGAVYLKEIAAGGELAAGQDAFAIGDLREAWLEVPVSEGQKAKLALGQFVQYTLADFPQRRFSGTVYEIMEREDPAKGGKESLIRISLPPGLDIQIRPGMKANAKISV